MNKFVVTPKEDKTVTMTIRIDRRLQEQYTKLAAQTNHSRNELIINANIKVIHFEALCS